MRARTHAPGADLSVLLEHGVEELEPLLARGSDHVLALEPDGTVAWAAPGTRAFLGLRRGRVAGARLTTAVAPEDLEPLLDAWARVRAGLAEALTLRIRARARDGRVRTLAVTLTDLAALGAGAGAGVVVNARDITDEVRVRARLDDHVTHDGLTGLTNRTALVDLLRERLAARAPGFALVLVDVVGMSGINDRIGHLNGDTLLRTVAVRLDGVLGSEAVVARTSGDEFAVVVPGVSDDAGALAVATELTAVGDLPMAVPGGGTVRVGLRAGVALSDACDGSPDGLFQDAVLALGHVRRARGADVCVCDDELRRHHRKRVALEHGLANPGLGAQLTLRYQPVVDLTTQRITGVEALVRWDHPELGRVRPGDFIPLAERTGAITRIGAWVLEVACRQLATWDAEGGADGLTMSVNVSARQLLDVELPATVARVLRETGVAAERVCLEITETALADGSEATLQTVDELVALGVRIHIDDFGTGYSSFAQLRRFTFHALKVDRSFVSELGRDPTTDVIVAGVVRIAQDLGLHVVAEGVERPEQREALRALGCDTGQGYLWARPVEPNEIVRLVQIGPGGGVEVVRPAFLAG